MDGPGGEASSSMTLASLGASFTDIRFNSTSTFLIPLPYATWIWSAVNGASSQYCFFPFSPMVCVCGKWLWNLWASRTRSRREHVFMHVSCITDLAFTSEHLSPPPSCGHGPSRRGRLAPLLSPVRVVPQSRENVIMVVRKDQICRPRPPVSQCDDVALAS